MVWCLWVLAELIGVASTAHAQAPPAPKVAVVVVGDADDALVTAASEVAGALGDALTQPADPGIRAALRGEAATEDDGLERLRRERRSLGISEEADLPALGRIGRMTGAVALAVVRRDGARVEVLVVDVGRSAFFDGATHADAPPEEVSAFVRSRADAAVRAAAHPVDHAESAVAAREAAQPRTTPEHGPRRARPPEPERDSSDAHDDDDGSFIDDAWPFLVAALLLVGAIVLFVIPDRTADPGPPVLRFVPGGS